MCSNFQYASNEVIGLIAGGQQAMTEAIEGAEDNYEMGMTDLKAIHLNEKDVVIGISASGRTPYVKGALTYANEISALTVAPLAIRIVTLVLSLPMH